MKNYKLLTSIVTFYLVVYTLLFHYDVPLNLLLFMFSVSPFLVIYMAYVILRYAPYNGKELKENEEWGYEDKAR